MSARQDYYDELNRQTRKDMHNESIRPTGNDIFEKLKNAKTRSELDSLRIESVKEMQSKDEDYFLLVQKAFIKEKNRIKRN